MEIQLGLMLIHIQIYSHCVRFYWYAVTIDISHTILYNCGFSHGTANIVFYSFTVRFVGIVIIDME